jgi:hypothetical protein
MLADNLVVGAGKLHLLPLSPPALVLERFFCSDTPAERYFVRLLGARENCLKSGY